MNDQFLKPLEQIQKAQPSKDLHGRIEAAIFDNKIIPMPTLALAAASILLLLFVNIYVVKDSGSKQIESSSSTYDNQLINNFQFY